MMDSPLMGRRRMVAMREPLDAHASCGRAEILISGARSLHLSSHLPPPQRTGKKQTPRPREATGAGTLMKGQGLDKYTCRGTELAEFCLWFDS